MKRTFKIISLFLVTVMLALPLASCSILPLSFFSDENLAFQIHERTDKKMSKLDSYASEIKMQGTFQFDNKEANVYIYGTDELSGKGTAGPRYHSEVTYEMSIPNISSSTVTQTRGYQDGKMYISVEEGLAYKNFYSNISAKDYENYLLEQSDLLPNFVISKETCGSAIATETDENGWSAVFSEFGDDVIAGFCSFIEDVIQIHTEIDDIKITFVTDSDLICKTLDIEFIFEDENTFKIEIAYEDTGKNKVNDINFEHYREIDDVRHIEKILNALNNVRTKSNGTINYNSTNTVTTSSTTTSVSESYIGDYCGEISNPSYSLTVNKSGAIYDLSYEDGIKSKYNKTNNTETTSTSTDTTELAFLHQLLDPLPFNILDIISIEKAENSDVYTLDMHSDLLDPYIPSYILNASKTTTAIFTFNNDVLEKYELTFVGTPGAVYDYTITVSIICRYT